MGILTEIRQLLATGGTVAEFKALEDRYYREFSTINPSERAAINELRTKIYEANYPEPDVMDRQDHVGTTARALSEVQAKAEREAADRAQKEADYRAFQDGEG